MIILRIITRTADLISDILGPPAPAATGGVEPGSIWIAALLEEAVGRKMQK